MKENKIFMFIFSWDFIVIKDEKMFLKFRFSSKIFTAHKTKVFIGFNKSKG